MNQSDTINFVTSLIVIVSNVWIVYILRRLDKL